MTPGLHTTPHIAKQSLPLHGVFGSESAFPLRYSLHRTIGTTRSVSRENANSELKYEAQGNEVMYA
jgi:hypothetical protein